jgi:hypothetical protein
LDKLGEALKYNVSNGVAQFWRTLVRRNKDSAFEGLLALDKSLMESDEAVGDKIVRLPSLYLGCRPVPPVALFAPRLDALWFDHEFTHALGSRSLVARHFFSSHRHGRHLRRVLLDRADGVT